MTITYNEAGVTYNSTFYTYNGAALGVIITRGLTDASNLTDSLSSYVTFTFNVSLSDTLTSTDIISIRKQLERTLADNQGITDSISREICIGRPLSDTEGITDTLVKSFNINILIQDVEGISDKLDIFVPFIGKKIIQILESREVKPGIDPFTITIQLKKIDDVKPQMG